MGKKTSTSTSQVSIPPEVLARYEAVNKRAEGLADTPFKQYGTTAEAFVAPINEQQLSGISNVNAATGLAQPYINAATGATTAGMASAQPGELEIAKYMNPYQQQVIDATMRQMGQANEQAQSGALGTAVSSGAFGGDRAGIAAANLANQQGMAMGSTLAGLNAQNYGQAVQTAQQQQGVTLGATQADLARLLSGGGQLANLGTTAQTAGLQGAEAQINAGTLQQQTEQAGKTALVNQFMQEQGYPFQVAQFLANIAMGTGSLSGSTTTTTQPAPFFSDRRLKEDVRRIGQTDDGLPIYKFKYKGDDTHQTHVGFMADEVEEKKPEAVGLHPSGYKTVDYDKATRNSMGGGVMPERAGQGFAGGGVAGPYGSAAGSQVDFGGYVPQAYLPVGQLMTADPALMDMSDQNVAALMERSANFGTNLQELDEQFGKGGSFWDMFKKQDEGYASGGAAYLNRPGGGLVPNTAKSYLSDTIESQSKDDKPELKTAEAGGGSGKSPAENILDLGKMAMMFMGMNGGGRVGYADGGTETEEQRLRRLLRRDVPEAQTLGSLPDAVVRPAVSLPNPPEQQFPGGGLVPAIPSPPEDRLATSPRPPARPTGLVPEAPRVGPTVEAAEALPAPAPTTPAPTMGDLNAAGIGAAKMTAPQAAPTGVAGAAAPAEGPLVNTGVAPKGGYNAIVPLQTQLDFVMHELQQPAYDDYLKRNYRTPSEAAIAFDTIYERSGGAGNKIAAANAEDVYAAAASGDMSGLPPNVATAYNHFVQGGMDPIQAAGAAGRLMVESYAHLDPNARNTIGGGYGTYGIAQWRGDRIENLARFAGVPLDAITSAPVSTPEGRYYSSTSGGDGYSGGLSRSTSNGDGGRGEGLGLRNFIRENAGNKDFLLSLLSGLGTMASSPSLYLGSAVLQGIGGAANTYMAREKQQADIRSTDASAMETTMRTAKDSIFPVDGVNMIMTKDGLVPFWEFLESGSKSTGNQLVDDMLRRIGQSAQSNGMDVNEIDLGSTISVPTGVQPGDTVSVPSNVMWTDASQNALAQDRALMSSQPGVWSTYVQQTAEILPAVTAERSAAVAAKPNVNELATVVANSIANGEMGTAGNAYAQYIVAPLKTLARSLGVNPDLIGSDADANKALLSKLSTLSATDMTPDQQRAAAVFQQVATIYPDLSMPPEAAAAITASVMLGNQTDIDRANYYNAYLQQQPTGRGALVNADAAFAEEYSQLHQAEKANITSLFLMASDKTPVGNNGMTKGDYVRKFLSDVHSGTISQERAQEVLNALIGPETSPALSRYFVKGM